MYSTQKINIIKIKVMISRSQIHLFWIINQITKIRIKVFHKIIIKIIKNNNIMKKKDCKIYMKIKLNKIRLKSLLKE